MPRFYYNITDDYILEGDGRVVEIYLLEQLQALEIHGTLSAAADSLHITQPALTRSMQKLESQFGVPLFIREKKRITLNDNGKAAARYAAQILSLNEEMTRQVQLMERNRRTLTFGTVSPGVVLEIIPLLMDLGQYLNFAGEVETEEELVAGLLSDRFHFVVLNREIEHEGLSCVSAGSERLYYCFHPGNDQFGQRQGVWFSEINGKTILSPKQVGAWKDVVKKHMPDSRLIFQSGDEDVNQIAEQSMLPAFASDIGMRYGNVRPQRTNVPILDPEATMNFFCIYKKKNEKRLASLLAEIQKFP